MQRLAGVDADLKDLTWRQLSELNAAYSFPGAPEEHFPSLEEFLSWFAWESLTVNIEIKNSISPYPLIESELLYAIDQYRLRDRVIVSSFNLDSVVEMKRLAPDLECAFLFKSRPFRALKAARENGSTRSAHFLNLYVPGFVSLCRYLNISVRFWTVNVPRVMRHAIRRRASTHSSERPCVGAVAPRRNAKQNAKSMRSRLLRWIPSERSSRTSKYSFEDFCVLHQGIVH